jgi:hypothetical protein
MYAKRPRFASYVCEASPLCFLCRRSVPALLFMYAKRPRFASYVGEEAYFASIEEAKRGRFAYCIRFSLRPLRIPRSAGL